MNFIFYLIGFILFFIGLIGAKFASYPHWIKFLYLLSFSIGYLTFVVLASLLNNKMKNFKQGLPWIYFAIGIIFFITIKITLPPLEPPKPDPFIIAHRQIIDWHLILQKTFSLPFFIFTAYKFISSLIDFFKYDGSNFKYYLFSGISSVLGILASFYAISLSLPYWGFIQNSASYFLFFIILLKINLKLTSNTPNEF